MKQVEVWHGKKEACNFSYTPVFASDFCPAPEHSVQCFREWRFFNIKIPWETAIAVISTDEKNTYGKNIANAITFQLAILLILTAPNHRQLFFYHIKVWCEGCSVIGNPGYFQLSTSWLLGCGPCNHGPDEILSNISTSQEGGWKKGTHLSCLERKFLETSM